jgi:hypothetical protein
MEDSMKSGIELIAEERQRQIMVERWTAEHDDTHTGGELSQAAAVYADAASAMARGATPEELHKPETDLDPGFSCYTGFDACISWPWDEEWLKLSPDPIRNLVKAGALIAAEIDRLQRLLPAPGFETKPQVGGPSLFKDGEVSA